LANTLVAKDSLSAILLLDDLPYPPPGGVGGEVGPAPFELRQLADYLAEADSTWTQRWSAT
jgi:hypothetical protein